MAKRTAMIWAARCSFAAVLLLDASATAAGEEPALFAAVKTFCLDTNVKSDAVKAAAEAAGATAATAPGIMALVPTGATLATWQVERPAGTIVIGAAAARPAPIEGKTQPLQEACMVQSYWRDDDGAARIRDWLGVASAAIPAASQEAYYFARRDDGSVAWAAPTSAPQSPHPATDGTMWMIMLVPAGSGVSVNVLHLTPPDTP